MQGKRAILKTLSGVLVFAITANAFAMMSLPCGWYAEANLGVDHQSDISYSPADSSSSDGAGNGNLGYKFMPYFATELGASLYTETKLEDSFGNKLAKVKHYSYSIAAKGIIPIIDSGFELFAKVGVARVYSNVTIQNSALAPSFGLDGGRKGATGIYLGAGGQYYIMPELAVNAQWQRATGDGSTGTFDLYSVGVSFIFY